MPGTRSDTPYPFSQRSTTSSAPGSSTASARCERPSRPPSGYYMHGAAETRSYGTVSPVSSHDMSRPSLRTVSPASSSNGSFVNAETSMQPRQPQRASTVPTSTPPSRLSSYTIPSNSAVDTYGTVRASRGTASAAYGSFRPGPSSNASSLLYGNKPLPPPGRVQATASQVRPSASTVSTASASTAPSTIAAGEGAESRAKALHKGPLRKATLAAGNKDTSVAGSIRVVTPAPVSTGASRDARTQADSVKPPPRKLQESDARDIRKMVEALPDDFRKMAFGKDHKPYDPKKGR